MPGNLLARFGQYLYDAGRPLTQFASTVQAVTDVRHDLRRGLQPAKDVIEAWKQYLPGSNHLPLPVQLCRAMMALAWVWGWCDVAMLIAIGFLAMLRPGELVRLRRRNLVFPADLLLVANFFLVGIEHPKMRRVAARHEHVRVEEALITSWLQRLLAGWGPDARLFKGTAVQFRDMFRQLVAFFDVDTRDGIGVTPASLRSGGASWLYLCGMPLEEIRWRGRWSTVRTLEVYIQELAASSLLAALPLSARARVQRFADGASLVLGL